MFKNKFVLVTAWDQSKIIENESFLNEFTEILIPEETLIPDNLLYLYNVNAVRHSYLYESSLGAREAYKNTKKDVNTCFYQLNCLACKRTIRFLMQEGGRRDFCQLHDVFQKSNGPSLRYYHVLQIFYVIKEFIYTCITRVVVVVVF